MIRLGLYLLLLLSASMATVASANAPGEFVSPREAVKNSITRVLMRIETERERLDAEPEYARELVREELDGLVDFKRITRLVMDEYFAKSSKEQKYAFLKVFKDGLINTYASGITLYQGQEITVLPTEEGDINGRRARVKTELSTNDGRVVPIHFSLYQDKRGAWMIENIIVNGLNLGKTFRAQFAQSAEQANGDIDQVIAGWSSELDRKGDQAPAASAEEPPAAQQ